MANKVRFIIDSTTDIPPELRHRFTVLPMLMRFGDEEYRDGVTITSAEFYRKLSQSSVMPTTSQATPFDWGQLFREAVNAGEDVLCMTMSSRLSGTFQSAMVAAEEFPGRVYVVDSRNVALASAVLAEYSLSLLDQGRSVQEVFETMMQLRDKVHLIALVDTLEYLQRGGRVSKTAAIAGGLLSIKPLITLRDGEVAILGKARGARNASSMMVQEIEKSGGIDFSKPVLLGYTGLDDSNLQKFMQDSASLWSGHDGPLRSTIVGSVIGTHAGPGCYAVGYFSK